jgi:hypothetical protein
MRHHCARHEEWRSYVDVEDGCVVFCRGFCNGFARQHTSIIHQNVDLVSEGFKCSCYNLLRCIDLGEVGLYDGRSTTIIQRLDVRCNLLSKLFTSRRRKYKRNLWLCEPLWVRR